MNKKKMRKKQQQQQQQQKKKNNKKTLVDNIVSLAGIHNEPPRGKTNNVVSEQVRHKPACTSTEKS